MTFGLYLVFIALLYLRPIEAFAPELGELRPMLVLSLTILALSLGVVIGGRPGASRRQYVGLLLAFIGAIAVSQIVAGWAGGAVAALADFAISAILFVTTLINVTTPRRLRSTCIVVAGCMVLLSAAGIAAYHTGFLADKLVLQQLGGEGAAVVIEPGTVPADDTSAVRLWRVRGLGFFADPNDFAQGIVTAAPLLAALYLRRRALRNLVLLGAPAAAMLYALFLTHSRGALLGVAAMLFFGVRRSLGAVRAGILLVLTMGAALALNFTGGRTYTTDEESAGGRIDAWVEGIRMLVGRPLFGVGYGNFTEHNVLTAHNSYVLCFAELGLVGYVLWLGMLVVATRKVNLAIALAPAGSDVRRWAAALASALVGYLACALFLSRSYEPLLYHLLALCLAAAYCVQPTVAAADAARLEAPARWAGAAVALALGSVIALYVFLRIRTVIVGTGL